MSQNINVSCYNTVLLCDQHIRLSLFAQRNVLGICMGWLWHYCAYNNYRRHAGGIHYVLAVEHRNSRLQTVVCGIIHQPKYTVCK